MKCRFQGYCHGRKELLLLQLDKRSNSYLNIVAAGETCSLSILTAGDTSFLNILSPGRPYFLNILVAVGPNFQHPCCRKESFLQLPCCRRTHILNILVCLFCCVFPMTKVIFRVWFIVTHWRFLRKSPMEKTKNMSISRIKVLVVVNRLPVGCLSGCKGFSRKIFRLSGQIPAFPNN